MEDIIHVQEKQGREEQMPPRKTSPGKGALFLVLLLALCAGFVGGLLHGRYGVLFTEYFLPSSQKVNEESRIKIISEDSTVVPDLVEKNSKGVVSIVISKDVPKVRSSQDLFFNFPFSSPFNSRPQSTETERRQIGSGSGFFVSPDGLIVTNKHVVSDEDAEYTVILEDRSEHKATVLARDPSNDIALIKIEGAGYPALTLGDSDAIRVGETIIVIGNPLGEFENSVSRGIVSGLQRNLEAGSGQGDFEYLSDIIQVDAAINPGNSGGPLFNLSGAVIGVNVAMAQGAENIGFALPINQVKRIAEQVRVTGKMSFPYLGIRSLVLNDELQKKTNLPFNYGALVLRGETATDFAVVPGSPAEKAGIMENDIVLEIDGKKIDEKHSILYYLGQYAVGDTVTVTLWQKGETKKISVILEERT